MTPLEQYDTIPKAPGGLPMVGHALPLLRDPLAFLASLPALGELVQIGLGTQRAVVVCTADLTRRVLLDSRTFDKGGPLYERVREVLGQGLGTCPYARHRRLRRLVQPAFHPARIKAYSPAIARQISSVTDAWQDGQSVDVSSQMTVSTSRALMATTFGTALSPQQTTHAGEDIKVITSVVYARMLQPAWLRGLPLPGNRRFERANARIRETITAVAAGRRVHGTAPACDPGKTTEHGSSLLSILLATQDTETDGQGMTDSELADELVTFFLAGIETTAILLAWALYLLARHPGIERRLHTEVDTVLAGRLPAHEDLPRLELTGRILTETLRLYPPVWLLTRTVTTDTPLAGWQIPAGTTIIWSPYLLHHDPSLYPDPENFDPDRWKTSTPHQDSYLPFGTGARKCIGDTFALTEATLALAHIASHWQLRPAPGSRVRARAAASLWPEGLRMQITARGIPPATSTGQARAGTDQ
ncbi:cytochrome P450 [Streptomyces sp. VNUA116]|uniref:cytochrome P450 n=1 Tax=Streptomyces sp. VNUA116 TaxID=3062449 RepID=UPI002674DA10|nr:cytochrome P450 [Streptomyces sp. VNUA116]WKU48687.1 cytochrome P450 [Streptomyces sp. VNUA116]